MSNAGRVLIFAGGVPLKRNGEVVGAIVVSGGSGEQDHTVAEARRAQELSQAGHMRGKIF